MTRVFAGDGFWKDWDGVPEEIQQALRIFSDRIKRNAFDPEIVGAAQIDRRSRYVFEFHVGWMVAWRTITVAGHVIPHDLDSTDIQLFAIWKRV